MKRNALASLFALCWLGLAPAMATAQTVSGSLTGQVTDASGAAVSNAKVTVRNLATNQTLSVTTSGDGTYTLPNLDPAMYEITIAAPGFEKATLSSVKLLLSSTVRNDVKLTVGSEAQTVNVTGSPDSITTDSGAIGDVIESQAIERLPLNGRTIDRVLTYVAGNTSDSPSSPNIGGGLRWGGTYYTVDGVPFNDLGNGAAAYSYNTNLTTLPSTETVAEVKVESSLAPAEYEGGTAIQVATKSGSNKFHGTAYEFNRNRAYAARSYFSPAPLLKPQLNRNEFGGVLGGPIWKDKTFFFGAAEALLQRQGSVYTFTVPTDAQRGGDFSAYAPLTDPNTGLPFAGNKLPYIDARAATILSYVPHANLSGLTNNLTQSVPTKYDVKRYTLRLDHNLNRVHTLTLSGALSIGDPYFAPNGTPAQYGNYESAGYTTQSALLRDNMVFTPHLLNEAHYSYLSHRSIRKGQNGNFDPYTIFPGLYGPFAIGGLPTVSMTGYTGIGDTGSSGHSPETTQQILDNVTLVHGKHTMKFGAAVNFNGLAIKSGTSSSTLGTFGFTGRYTANTANPTGNAFADFLLGYANTTTRATPQIPIYLKYQNYAFFGQDDWVVTPRLTLNFGLRYVLQTSPTEANGAFTNFDFAKGVYVIRSVGGQLPSTVNQTALSLYPNTYTTSEQDGWGQSVLQTDKSDWGPRLGFAYRPLSGDKLVVRGGYGMFYNFVPTYIGIRQISQLNFPFTLTQSYTASSSTTPTLTLANPFPGTGTVSANPTIYAVNRDLKNTRVQQWNLSMEEALPSNVGLRVSYVGNQATHAPWYYYDKNEPYPMRALTTLQSGRPYQPWGDIYTLVTEGFSITHQLQIEATKRTGHGLYLQTSYTWGKSLDNVPITYGPQNPADPSGDYSNGDGERHHNFYFSGTYELPIHRTGFGSRLTNGWSVSSLTQVRSGIPFTPTFSIVGNVGWYATRPNIVPGVGYYSGAHTLSKWFNPAAFTAPTPYTFGNARRNILFGPHEIGFDASLEKKTTMRDGVDLLLRFDAFNAVNTPNFSTPSSNISVGNAGVISGINSTTPNRQVQIGGKIVF
ncbi:Carboxypeptidase regulatory-like domain-containing protein [Bryocella elongata]|uniref:Carboxypeptidase regulatory-like domain-containing protein n=1 Tax=Bryocella elongata TaxID=863522 RepID=A0A1H6C2Q4_9BACT|nr:carboxypeptidase-like regulatory domain-containing protein [Bryocella elongata]SEG67290.1 Carboxypeptidase regulatory-like domain-containing protein [Bryocella elongata]